MKSKWYLFKQSQSKTWFEQRKLRISATKAHKVINTRMSHQKVVNILMSNSVLKGKASMYVCSMLWFNDWKNCNSSLFNQVAFLELFSY